MNTNPHQIERPLAVKFAVILLLINIGTGFAQQAINADWGNADWRNPLVYVKWGSQLLMITVPLLFIFRGKNWARWLLVVFAFAGFCWSLPQLIQDFQARAFYWVIDYFRINLISLIALTALFLPSSSQWFRGRRIAVAPKDMPASLA